MNEKKKAIITVILLSSLSLKEGKKNTRVHKYIHIFMSPAIRIDCLIGSITKYNLNLSSLKLHYDLLTTIERVA